MKNAQFIAWMVTPDGRKLPVSPRTGKTIDAHDSAHWVSEDEARARLKPDMRLAYVFTGDDPYFFVDLDKCLQEDGTWSPLAMEICGMFPTAYKEVSQSGKGLHIIASARSFPSHACKNTALKIELYHEKRFIALTGTNSQGSAEADYTETLAILIGRYFKPAESALNRPDDWTESACPEWCGYAADSDLIEAAKRTRSNAVGFGGKASFADLWMADADALGRAFPPQREGQPYDASSADAALAAHLAFWTGRDCERIKRLMLQSALVRDKWVREDYLNRTILNAAKSVSEVYRRRERIGQACSDGLAPAMRYRLLTATDLCNTPPMRWTVRGVLPAEGLAALYGPSGSGKSFLILDMGCAVAAGDAKWFGRRVKQSPVTYVCLEGEAGLGKRAKAWSQHHGKPLPDTLHFVIEPFDLLSGDVTELAKVVTAGGLIILDTLNRAAPGADENSSVDMGRIIAAATKLQTMTGGLVLVVHHTGKDAGKGLRGHSSLYAALDCAIEVIKTDTRRAWSVAKSKDDITGNEHSFRLEIVPLGKDDDGEVITSCVIVPDESAHVARKQKHSLGANQKIARDALGEPLRKSPHTGKEGTPTGTPCINYDEAVSIVSERMPTDAKHRKTRAISAIGGLVSKGILGMKGDWLWSI